MSYFDEPKRNAVSIVEVENGYVVAIGESSCRKEIRRYIATKENLAKITIDCVDIANKDYEKSIKEWEEKEKKTSEGYEWSKKKQ